MCCRISDNLSASGNSLQRALKVSYKLSIQTHVKTVQKKTKVVGSVGKKL